MLQRQLTVDLMLRLDVRKVIAAVAIGLLIVAVVFFFFIRDISGDSLVSALV